jgi:hypothetical protein
MRRKTETRNDKGAPPGQGVRLCLKPTLSQLADANARPLPESPANGSQAYTYLQTADMCKAGFGFLTAKAG